MNEPSEAEAEAVMARMSGVEINELLRLNGLSWNAYAVAAEWRLKETAQNERLREALKDICDRYTPCQDGGINAMKRARALLALNPKKL